MIFYSQLEKSFRIYQLVVRICNFVPPEDATMGSEAKKIIKNDRFEQVFQYLKLQIHASNASKACELAVKLWGFVRHAVKKYNF